MSPFLGPSYEVPSGTVSLVPVTQLLELQTKTEATNKKQTQNKRVCGTGSLAWNEILAFLDVICDPRRARELCDVRATPWARVTF